MKFWKQWHGMKNLGDEIRNWLHADAHDSGYQILSDEQIVSIVSLSEQDTSESENEIEVFSSSETTSKVSNTEVFNALSIALDWLQNQPESQVYSKSVLESLENLAASKRIKTNFAKEI